jgi:hypothetical protein
LGSWWVINETFPEYAAGEGGAMVYGLVKKRAVILGKAGRVKIMEGEMQLFRLAETSSLEK